MTPPATIDDLTAETPVSSRPKVGFVSLGCPKNLVDSEVMMGLLHHNGAELTPHAEDAEIIVINTCSFIDSAKQESVNTILEMVQHKQQNGGKAQRIVVAGCLVERYREELRQEIPEIDACIGVNQIDQVLEAIEPNGRVRLPVYSEGRAAPLWSTSHCLQPLIWFAADVLKAT